MIAYWKFDDGFGTEAGDSSGYGNDGTIYGATWTTGKVGNALSFDGVDDYIEVPHSSSLDITGSITLEAWVRPAPKQAQAHGYIVQKLAYIEGTDWGYGLSIMWDEFPHFTIRSGPNGWASAIGTTAVNDGDWHHLVGTFNGTHACLYVDGVLEDCKEHPYGPASNTKPLWIGRIYYQFYKGDIDEVAIYNRALSEEEIVQHHQNGLNGLQYCTPYVPVVPFADPWPKLNEMQGEIASLNSTLQAIRSELIEKNWLIGELNASVENLRTKLQELASNLATLRTQLSEVGDRVSALEFDVAELEKAVSALREDVSVLNTTVADLDRRVTALEAWRGLIDAWHAMWNSIIETIYSWYTKWHEAIEEVVLWKPGAEQRISKLEEEMKYITVKALLETGVEKNYTIIEKEYVKCLAQSWPGEAAFSAKSFKKYLNEILPDQHVVKVLWWERGYTGELVTGECEIEKEGGPELEGRG
jgi:hypothetical protein